MSAPLRGPDPKAKLVSLRDVLAYNVRASRVEKSLSQEELGFAAGLDRTFISQVERARVNVSVDNIERLAIALDVDPAGVSVSAGRGAVVAADERLRCRVHRVLHVPFALVAVRGARSARRSRA